MNEIAKCTFCGKEPLLLYIDNELIELSHCGVSCSSPAIWNKIAAAMDLVEARAWRKEVWEETQKPWPFVKELRRSWKMVQLWSIFDSFDYAEVCVKKAEKRVDEVFV